MSLCNFSHLYIFQTLKMKTISQYIHNYVTERTDNKTAFIYNKDNINNTI